MKLRLIKNGFNATPGYDDLYLEDGSMVHMDRYTDYSDNEAYLIDYVTPSYLLDPYSRKTILAYAEVAKSLRVPRAVVFA